MAPTHDPPPPYVLEDIDEDDQARLLLSEERRDLDDASRDLPHGWARCYDARQAADPSRQKHHYYVDESTLRTIWYHPLDDAQYLSTLPITHPAHPESKQAQGIKKKIEDARLRRQKGLDVKVAPKDETNSGAAWSTDEKKPIGEELAVTASNGESSKGGWFSRTRDSFAKSKQDKQRAKAEKEEGFRKQRQTLLDDYAKEKMAKTLAARSTDNRYPAPDFPITRTGSFSNTPYAYGKSFHSSCNGIAEATAHAAMEDFETQRCLEEASVGSGLGLRGRMVQAVVSILMYRCTIRRNAHHLSSVAGCGGAG
ncbi:hypothetical protein L198_06053 [Cryptococcus wingfieldii CBS 7118]|uniref:WW domain-containing protein n=1 Tax=Cryptococcus wingfieldii CBS 7118 TaxID=1295528 RepID=A0A1E3IQ58_9TREE|nr:hypothetical protein L198_06053 [Cryptococcus wingfieldii CBS 7118]ODN90737.1 hypothetical protein L198_06053 [Cryptococcus wingfieldii CBS 7118]